MDSDKRQSLPDINTESFKQRVKELLEIREGLRANPEDAFVTHKELSQYDMDTTPEGIKNDGQPPAPPKNFFVETGEFANELSWEKSTAPDIWYYEIWRANTNNRNEAEQIAIVTHPNQKYKDDLKELAK